MSDATARSLEKIATSQPGVEEGVACAGTAIESRAFKIGGKTFLFLSATQARLKLAASLDEATRLAVKRPKCLQVGAQGWVKITLGSEGLPTQAILKKWVRESCELFVPKRPAAKKKSR